MPAEQPERGDRGHDQRQQPRDLQLPARRRPETDRMLMGMDRLADPEGQHERDGGKDRDPMPAVEQAERGDQHGPDGDRLEDEQHQAASITQRKVAQAPQHEGPAQDRRRGWQSRIRPLRAQLTAPTALPNGAPSPISSWRSWTS